MRVVNYEQTNMIRLPVYGAGTDIVKGALLMAGASAGTDFGTLIVGASALADSFGILQELHDYSVTGDTNAAGTVFVTHPVDLVIPARFVRVEYSMGTSDDVACTQAVNTTTMTVASLEDNIDTSFIYVVRGTGAGQTNYLTASASGSCTLKAAFGTDLDTTSNFIKILRRFHQLIGLTSDGTKLTSTAAAGSGTALIVDSFIVRDNNEQQLDPTKHSALTGLDSYSSLRFEALVAFRNTAPYTTE